MISINKNILNIKNPNSGEYEQVAALQGKSAYEIAVDNGFEGTEQEYLDHVASINRSAEEFRNDVTELSNRIADRFEEMESVHNKLSSEIDKLIGVEKISGYYNICNLPNAEVHKNKKLIGFNTATFIPEIVNSEGYITVIVPINFDLGSYTMILGEDIPANGICCARYKDGVNYATCAYSQLSSWSGWDGKYNSEKKEFTYLTSTIGTLKNKPDYYIFCFHNTEPIVYVENPPKLKSGELQIPKCIGVENFSDKAIEFILENNVDICISNDIYIVQGREFNIYFDNILLMNNPSKYNVDVTCNIGKQENERWTVLPANVGNYPLTIRVLTYDRSVVLEKTVNIHVVSTNGNSITKKVCLIGDSWTDHTWYPARLFDRFKEDSDTIKLIGTRAPWGGNDVKHEGRSGWKATDYTTKSALNSVTNAFWNPTTNKFDFAYYLSNNSLEVPNIVTIFLGINDASANEYSKTIESLEIMIRSIITTNANIKVGIALLPPPCLSQDGFGKNNACGVTMYQQKYNAFQLSKLYMSELNKMTGVFFIPVICNVDMVHNVTKETVTANAYTDVEIERVTDNVHCNRYGFEQVADTFYGALKQFYN